jgi:hypothetical protein
MEFENITRRSQPGFSRDDSATSASAASERVQRQSVAADGVRQIHGKLAASQCTSMRLHCNTADLQRLTTEIVESYGFTGPRIQQSALLEYRELPISKLVSQSVSGMRPPTSPVGDRHAAHEPKISFVVSGLGIQSSPENRPAIARRLHDRSDTDKPAARCAQHAGEPADLIDNEVEQRFRTNSP